MFDEAKMAKRALDDICDNKGDVSQNLKMLECFIHNDLSAARKLNIDLRQQIDSEHDVRHKGRAQAQLSALEAAWTDDELSCGHPDKAVFFMQDAWDVLQKARIADKENQAYFKLAGAETQIDRRIPRRALNLKVKR